MYSTWTKADTKNVHKEQLAASEIVVVKNKTNKKHQNQERQASGGRQGRWLLEWIYKNKVSFHVELYQDGFKFSCLLRFLFFASSEGLENIFSDTDNKTGHLCVLYCTLQASLFSNISPPINTFSVESLKGKILHS